MMTKIHFFISVALLFASFVMYGQYDSEHLFNNSNRAPVFDLNSNNLLGSSYLNEQFLPVKLANSEKTYLMRYNAYTDEMEFEKNGQLFYVTKAYNFLINFESLNKDYQVFSYQENNSAKDGYFVVLSKGNQFLLLMQEKIKYFGEVKARSSYNNDKPASLRRLNDKLNIGYKNNTTSQLPNKKNDLLKLFASKSAEIEVYAKKNKLGFKNNEDLIQIFGYYNSLQ
ncbi:MAG: hypothetical protein P1P79_07455 [Lutibacter sp.]|nr:hypothetical protein [Lutibacter sp.]